MNIYRILIVIDKQVDPIYGSGVASWAIDLKEEFRRQYFWCEIAGYYKKDCQFNINGRIARIAM